MGREEVCFTDIFKSSSARLRVDASIMKKIISFGDKIRNSEMDGGCQCPQGVGNLKTGRELGVVIYLLLFKIKVPHVKILS